MAISDKPWGGFSEADYPTAEAYCDACLINMNEGAPADWTKADCKLPVREPNGDVNRNAVHAAAAVLAGGRGGVTAPAAMKMRAANKLMLLYGQMKEMAPDSLRRMAGS